MKVEEKPDLQKYISKANDLIDPTSLKIIINKETEKLEKKYQ